MTGECQNFKSTSGFTLLEMMVVLVIASLMFTLVPPLFSGAVSGTRLKGSARDLAVVLRETRSRAIIRNTEQLVHLDLESPRYRSGNGKPQTMPEGMAMTVEVVTGANTAGLTKHVVRFFPDGSSSGELITLSSGNHAYYLQLNWLTGSITITEGALDDS